MPHPMIVIMLIVQATIYSVPSIAGVWLLRRALSRWQAQVILCGNYALAALYVLYELELMDVRRHGWPSFMSLLGYAECVVLASVVGGLVAHVIIET
jgi:hypothetical protein